MYQHILLPTDGSELSEKAIRNGIQLAKSLNAKVTGFHVVVETRVAAGLGKIMRGQEDAIEAAKQFLAVIADQAREAGVPCECFYVTGDSPHEEIIKAATEKGCDLIFMASHGRRGIAGLLLGSETVKVLTHCKIPMLVHR